MKPQEPIPHNYSMGTLNRIFALSSIALLLVTGAIVAYDYIRGWKRFQIEFMRLERERVVKDLSQAEKATDEAELTRLDAQIRDGERQVAQRRDEYRAALVEVEQWEGRRYAADQAYRFGKAELDAMRYAVDQARATHAKNVVEVEKAYTAHEKLVADRKLHLESVQASYDAAQARAQSIGDATRVAQAEKAEAMSAVDRLRKRLESVSTNTNFFILNAPLLDFISPTLKVDQVVIEDMFLDINYMHIPRVDRCATCHRAIDRPGFESKKEAARLQAELERKLELFQIAPGRIADTRQRIEALIRVQKSKGIANPYRTHPFLDVFAGSASAHPVAEFGCTACHGGLDRATEFSRAGHSPSTHKQQSRWTRKWNWASQPFLATPMFPKQYVQASCVKCHQNQISIPNGEQISRGEAMVELYGCHACHKIDSWRFSNLRKPGPDLRGIAEKTTPEWVSRWIADPTAFRPMTRMPSFFFQRNMIGPEVPASERVRNIRFQNAEVQAITSYLFSKSTRRVWATGVAGDVDRGKKLVETIGCLACHIEQDTVKDAAGVERIARRDDFPLERHYGFNFAGTATKSNPAWLYNWIRDPRAYYASAPMPDLRLAPQEAGDITAYLMTLARPEFLAKPLPSADAAAVTELAKTYLATTMTGRQSDEFLGKMSPEERLNFLGQRSIEKYGCYSCHEIDGFDGLRPIGTELTIEGSKVLHLFDFGTVHEYEAEDGSTEHIDHTVPSWIYSKLRSPRVWDDKRERGYQDKLKMPNFHLSKSEAESIASVVLGLTKERVDASKIAGSDPRSRAVQEGRKLISQRNCRGCHLIDGQGRAIATTIEDPGMLPPDLGPQGSRVQPSWLFAFLQDPTFMTLRPWLGVRMPTFHFSDAETNTIVQGWAADGKILSFDSSRQIQPDAKNVAIGKTVFEMLRCAQCHPAGGASVAVAQDAAALAPDLAYARVRLQHEWIPEWIRRPNEIMPGTRMPTNFPRDPETGEFDSPLILAVGSPQFASYRDRLVQLYGSDETMMKGLSDVVSISNYLRDYIWTLGPSELRGVRTPTPTFSAPGPAPDQQTPVLGSAQEQNRSRPSR